MLKLIACVDKEFGIGKENKIPWKNSEEMKHFKETTTNHIVVMGRKTFESISKPLKDRTNIVFSKQDIFIDGCEVTSDIEYILNLSKTKDVFVIGGSEIYKLFENYYDELIISYLDEKYDCDKFLKINLKFFYETKIINHDTFKVVYYKSYKDKLLFGSVCSNKIKKELNLKINNLLPIKKRKPNLVIIQIGNNQASNIYVRNKINLANSIDISVNLKKYDSDVKEKEIIDLIEKLNNDQTVDGILVQLPIDSDSINQDKIIKLIDYKKDVDCFHPINIGEMWFNKNNNDMVLPCTSIGIIELLKFYNVEIKSKNVVILGRSNVVTKPLVQLFLNEDATVQICHSKTTDLKQKTMNADILVSAIGKANFITSDYVKEGCVIVDVGINSYNKKVVGDVDFNDVIQKVSFISPVPYGVGPMTLVMLLKNLIICWEKND